MENETKLDLIHNISQKIYLSLAIMYVLVLPIIVSVTCILNARDYTLFIWHIITLFISILVFFTFLIENVFIDRQNLKKFKSIKTILIFFTLFLICSTISTFLSSNIALSIFGEEYRGNGLISFFSYAGYILLGMSLNKKNRNMVLHILCYVSFIMAIFTLFPGWIYNTILPAYTKYTGIFFNINHYGYYLAYTIIACVYLMFNDKTKLMKLVDLVIYITLVCMLIVNDTFGSYLAVLFTLLLTLVYCIKKKIFVHYIFLIIPFVILSLFIKVDGRYPVYENFKSLAIDVGIVKEEVIDNGIQDEYNYDSEILYVGNYRGALWVYGLKFTKEKPLFGFGLDNLGEEYWKYGIPFDMPHNLFLNLSATIGIPGMLFYVIGLLIVIIKGIKNYNKKGHLDNLMCAVIITHFVSSMFGNTMYYVTPYYVIILGMGMLSLNEKENLSNN